MTPEKLKPINKGYYSNCCGAYMPDYPDSDICPECGEHCEGEG